ncbi:hypothetical protein CANINC_002773 [Pichia inconspicua]|uniref:Uncharacterized protein n=1 Tax=Pichia inconspicua TaxID=52247 RepID=A0A4T0X0E0_9ASCO|nr:hypothetical protein CANINC_002773 [[Candida] inconspicua]
MNEDFSKGSSQQDSHSSTSDEKTLQLTQRFKLLTAGLAAIGLTIAALNIYQNWSFIKSYFGGDNLESFDAMYERIKDKKQKKQLALEKYSKEITNPNGIDVPGVYICGNNQNQLISTEKDYDYVPVFKRLDVFDNFIVKDVAIGDSSGALINHKGDLYQWGLGYNGDSKKPTLKGKHLKRVQISNNAVYVLAENGDVLYLPENAELQKEIRTKEKGWLGSYDVNYSKLQINTKIADIAAGKEHLILKDINGAVYTTATGLDDSKIDKSNGQFGLPEFSQFDDPPKVNEVHEVVLLNKYMKNDQVLKRQFSKVAAGDYFSLCLDKSGVVWAFGKNTFGAVGSTINYDSEIIPYPTQVQFISSHFKRNEFPRCIDIYAGGETAFATFASSNMYEIFEKSLRASDTFNKKFTFDDLESAEQDKLHLSWGHGLKGELGLGHFIHGSYEPKKIKVLNEIKEFNEVTNKLEKIGVKRWSCGKNHCVVTLGNNDVYVWGDNEFGQLGNGKKIRAAAPITIPSILEPNKQTKDKFAKFNNRLQLYDNGKIHQEIVAGRDTTAIVYKKNE